MAVLRVHILCNFTKKFPTAKVLELLKKDSSKFAKTLNSNLRDFHWQDGYGLFSVSPSHFEPVRKYILNQEEHHKKETFQDEYLRILKKYRCILRRTVFVGLRKNVDRPFRAKLVWYDQEPTALPSATVDLALQADT